MPLFSRRRPDRPAVEAPVATQAAPAALVAAATRLRNDHGYRSAVIRKSGWQTEAWRQYDLSGELRFAANWTANSLSRVRLTVNDVSNGRIMGETTNEQAIDLMEDLLGDPSVVACLLHDWGLNASVAGDGYLVELDEYDWMFVSTEQISEGPSTGTVLINLGDNDQYILKLSEHVVVRVHRPHPRKWIDADSPARGALPILREIEELGKYEFATIGSRIAGAGILGIASELSFPAAAEEVQAGETPFMATLAEAMLTPIADPGDPSAVVPIVVQGPKEHLPTQDNWVISPAATLTEVVATLREAAIRRLAVALDIPTEILAGAGGDSSRWHAWATEESGIKLVIEPLAILFAAAITRGVLRDRLEAAGLDPDAFAIWIDSTELVQRPDRSANAITANGIGLLSDAATRRELGFTEEDAPKGEEKVIFELFELIKAAPQTADVLAPVLAKLLGFEVPEVAPPDGTPKNGEPPPPATPDRPAPSDNPRNG